MSKTAITMMSTAWLEEGYIGGDGRRPYGLGFLFGKFWSRERRMRARVRREALYGARSEPRHVVDRGGLASAREKGSTASRWPPAHGEDEDDFVPGFF
jgi:hypothetical protein